jgi:hypothetical protein
MTCANKRINPMRTFFSKRWLAALQVAACILVILACQLPFLPAQPVGVPATPGANAGPTSEATPEAPSGSTPDATPADVVFGSGPFNLMDPAVGLIDLSSYKATLTLSYIGTQSGQPIQWSHKYVMLASQENEERQITFEAAGGDPAPFVKAEINGVSYVLDGEKNCAASLTEAGSSLSAEWEPAGFLSAIIGAEVAGSETVNGVASDQYTFDERALGEPGFTKSTGQVWVAVNSGVVVRYLLTTTAGADYFGEGNEGTLTSEYNLTDINQPVAIDLPAGCPVGEMVDAPLMPAAQDALRLPGVTIYSTAGSIQDVFAFYQAQLPALGWEASGDPVAEETMGTAVFAKGDQQLTVLVTMTENGVEVHLVLGPAPASDANP